MDSNGSWNIPCSEDGGEQEPSFDELDEMYQKLANGENFELNWKCIGRRQPTPTNVTKAEIKEDSNADA